eukprot:TRINITY_DN9284_c0_g1_i1.p1 TRINITY_DN9284_c0_g1~~TRINITY_DN9284_c0_g1_i1.p1  ORF type:complete len:642 (+),score=169.87 TRINITY_DN9284_c0_g1_i1:56-1981(+)
MDEGRQKSKQTHAMLRLMDEYPQRLLCDVSACYAVSKSADMTTIINRLGAVDRELKFLQENLHKELSISKSIVKRSENAFRHMQRWKRYRQTIAKSANTPIVASLHISQLMQMFEQKTRIVSHSTVRDGLQFSVCASPSREVMIQFLVGLLAQIVRIAEILRGSLSTSSAVVDTFFRVDFLVMNASILASVSRIYVILDRITTILIDLYNLIIKKLDKFCPQSFDKNRDCPKLLQRYIKDAYLPSSIDYCAIQSSSGRTEASQEPFSLLVKSIESGPSSPVAPSLPVYDSSCTLWRFHFEDKPSATAVSEFGEVLSRTTTTQYVDNFAPPADTAQQQSNVHQTNMSDSSSSSDESEDGKESITKTQQQPSQSTTKPTNPWVLLSQKQTAIATSANNKETIANNRDAAKPHSNSTVQLPATSKDESGSAVLSQKPAVKVPRNDATAAEVNQKGKKQLQLQHQQTAILIQRGEKMQTVAVESMKRNRADSLEDGKFKKPRIDHSPAHPNLKEQSSNKPVFTPRIVQVEDSSSSSSSEHSDSDSDSNKQAKGNKGNVTGNTEDLKNIGAMDGSSAPRKLTDADALRLAEEKRIRKAARDEKRRLKQEKRKLKEEKRLRKEQKLKEKEKKKKGDDIDGIFASKNK